MAYDSEFKSALAEALKGVGAVHAVGEEWHSFTGEIPGGGLPYTGQEVLRETYSSLWAYVQEKGLVKSESEWQSVNSNQNGNVPYYSDGDGYTTFRLPKIVGYIKGAQTQQEAGSYVHEGLPNIVGDISADASATGTNFLTDATSGELYESGALFVSQKARKYYMSNGSTIDTCPTALGFDASRVSPVYGGSTHVTPETTSVLFGVYAFGVVTNAGELDALTLANSVAQVSAKVDSKIEALSDVLVAPYEAGDTFNAYWWGCGTLTGSNKHVIFSLPLSRPVNAASFDINITQCSIRSVGTYLVQNATNMASLIDHKVIQGNALEIQFNNNSGWGGTNNSVVSVAMDFVVTFK